ncbi:Chlorohydrolase family protein [Penicillium digitatum]|uniref:Probable guanine deaminase n=3 Tax=Penicillium digitatum TaxID=36651 RepID=K9FKM3_PEND2|nr:Chlorohydrolase family protein [Penicillium digitatum Pd1]EKV08478.1 Chlorohydrolase family protein [Penicillium digitatum Pd1]EKV10130.1 Chlorohydrolase family protein [Penicillium digitatum PHI26]QQK41810.1 Chlorohydrolase family protein [Penicillium digitatum]
MGSITSDMGSPTDYAFTVYRGTFIQSILPDSGSKPELSRNQGALWVCAVDGRIRGWDWHGNDEIAFAELMSRSGWVDIDTIEAQGQVSGHGSNIKVRIVTANEEKNEFFFPGFIDTHIHAPQYPNAGLFGSSTLLDWLETYTFPVESRFGSAPDPRTGHQTKTDPQETPLLAQKIYDQVISRTLSHGTTCASYYATNHIPATNALSSLCHTRGQRAFVGRACMDNTDFCVDYYRDFSADDSVVATRQTIEYIHTLDPEGKLVKPIITPRFAPSCTRPALQSLGELAASYSPPLHIQTHISENMSELALVKELFPEADSYAAVYDKYNLLTPRTILAHAVHLSADERALIRAREAKISHCPASNSALGSGICPVRTLLDEGITVGLGTDVSGGYSPSILEAARQACLASRLLGQSAAWQRDHMKGVNGGGSDGWEKLSAEESLYLATRGGAAVVDMASDLGGFDMGMLWDVQLIRLGGVKLTGKSPLDGVPGDGSADLVKNGPVGNVDLFGTESWEEKIQKWLWGGDDRNVKAVWVGGRLVHSRA